MCADHRFFFNQNSIPHFENSVRPRSAGLIHRASDFFHDWLAEVTHGAKNGESFNDGPKHIKLTPVDIWVVYFKYTLTQTPVCIYVY